MLLWQSMALNTAHHQPLRKLTLIALVIIAACSGLWPRAASAQDVTQQVLDSINAARAENGLAPLVVNPLLSQAAQNHVNDMITNYVYGHYGSDGSTVQMRVARTGYSATPWVSENWVSASDASGAMRWWMGDYIHRVNILTARWVEIGIGAGSRGSEMIFVTVFSAGGGATSDTAAIAAAAAAAPPLEAPPPPSVHIEQVSVPAEGMDYSVQGGDTLLAIGLRYGLPWERIAEANGLNEASLLQIGQSIRIPGSGNAEVLPVPDVETEEYIIQPNDTLFSIAAQRGMIWEDVAAVNGFGEQTILQIGQVIKVPVVEEAAAAVSAESKNAETTLLIDARRDTVGPVMPQQAPDTFTSYTLKQFDPAQSWASGTSQTTMASTGIGGPVGDATQVAMAKSSEGAGATSAVLAAHAAAVEVEAVPEVAPKEAAAEAVTAEVAPTLYTVQPGDTIISIAIKHDLAWDSLLAINGLDENSVLQLGQMIRLR